jgi:imidazolonepropionase-like amidohydrolase
LVSSSAEPSTFLIRDVRIFDGRDVVLVGSVLVRGGIITEVGATIVPPDECVIIDGRGQTLLPGLIDAHIHLPLDLSSAERALRQGLAFGVTTPNRSACSRNLCTGGALLLERPGAYRSRVAG